MDTTRQRDIVNDSLLNLDLAIVGAGAIGSFTAVTICKMGYQGGISIYDDDTVQEHNLPNQFYDLNDVGRPKVTAIKKRCYDMSGKYVEAVLTRIESVPLIHEACIFAVDSMDTRIKLYKNLHEGGHCQWLIDGRMGGEIMRIYTVNLNDGNDRSLYQNSLYTSAEADHIPCTAQSVIYNVNVIAGLITNQLKKVLLGQAYSREIVLDLDSLTFFAS